MPRIKIWTYDEAKNDAKKYKDLNDYTKNSESFHQARKNGWLNDFKEFLPLKKEMWTKEKIHKIALKYTTKKEFCDKEPRACHAAYSNNWMDDIDDHFKKLGSRFSRLIYVYEFPDNHAYVGLTYSELDRKKSHLDIENSRSAVSRHIQKTGLVPTYKTLTEFMTPEEAANVENCTIEKYRSEGWIILNKQKGGGLGACKRTELTMEIIRDMASKFKTRNEFKLAHKNVYQIAQKYGWLEDVFRDIPVQDRTKWTFDKVKELADTVNSRAELKYLNSSAYQSARKNGWLDILFPKN
jgi:hypothetical protein